MVVVVICVCAIWLLIDVAGGWIDARAVRGQGNSCDMKGISLYKKTT